MLLVVGLTGQVSQVLSDSCIAVSTHRVCRPTRRWAPFVVGKHGALPVYTGLRSHLQTTGTLGSMGCGAGSVNQEAETSRREGCSSSSTPGKRGEVSLEKEQGAPCVSRSRAEAGSRGRDGCWEPLLLVAASKGPPARRCQGF